MSPIITTMSAPSGRSRRIKAPSVTAVAPFFEDSFAGLQKNNANGFTWEAIPSGDVSVVSFDGYNCLRFRYGPNAVDSDDSAEQRFYMGRYLNEAWIEYWVHVPSNYSHRNDPGTDNNKWFAIWRDTYSDTSGGTQQFTMELWNLTGADATQSTWRLQARSTEFGLQSDIPNDPKNQALILGGSGPIQIGQWNQIRYAFRGSSSFQASDGYFKMWVNGTLFQSLVGFPFHNYFDTPSDVKYKNGYFMGYSNSGFTNETDFHIRDVKFYDTNPGW